MSFGVDVKGGVLIVIHMFIPKFILLLITLTFFPEVSANSIAVYLRAPFFRVFAEAENPFHALRLVYQSGHHPVPPSINI